MVWKKLQRLKEFIIKWYIRTIWFRFDGKIFVWKTSDKLYRFFENKLKKDDIKNKEKEELIELINEMRPCSLWERNFEILGKQQKWEKKIYEIHDLRNKVAHSKK